MHSSLGTYVASPVNNRQGIIMQSEIFVFLTLTIGITLAAVDDCLQSQFWNGTHCVSCSLCPPGHGVKTNCSKKLDTECEACIAGYDYSDTTGFESCLGCDKFSHCPLTNAKEVNKCTVYSKRVCDGCLDGYFLNPGTGGCEECSLPCGFNKIETRPCTTDHDRTCSPKAIVPTILATNSTPKEVSKRVFKPSVKPRTPPNQIDGDSPSPQETKIVKNHWLWISISIGVVVLIAVTILMIFCYRRKKRNQKGRRNRAANARSDEETRDRQEVIPLMQGLDLPIKDLTIDGKMFIAQRLNGKNSFGYYYWQPTGEKLGFHSECRAWETAENPTEKLLKAYGEKAGSTVRNLVKALRDPEVGQTQFANEIEIKFSSSTTQDQNKGESSGEIESNV